MMGLRLGVGLLLLSLVAGCASSSDPKYVEPAPEATLPGDENVKIGNPYTIAGITYYPRVDPYYDVTGYASWYGPKFHGKQTANGETYDMNALTAAHKTLPMPSYVRVTNLTNGRSLVLRVNDRGPFVDNRIIDLSRRAAQLLGFEDKGIERVRVQVVNSDGTPIPRPVDGGLTPVPVRTADNDLQTETLESLPEPALGPDNVQLTPETQAPNGNIYVQVASFASEQNAASFAGYLSDLGPTDVNRATVNNSLFYRVRLGAYKTMEEALSALSKVKNLGFSDARIFTPPDG